MNDAYFTLKNPGSYTGLDKFHKSLKFYQSKKNVEKWLQSVESYNLHKPVRRKFARRKTFVTGIDQLWQIDLIDFSAISNHNNGHKFALIVVDVFSRFLLGIEPLLNKTASSVTTAFVNIIKKHARKPAYVQSDKGLEFTNTKFQNFLKESDILFYTSENNTIKAAVVERLIQTLKNKLYRYFTQQNTYYYLNILDDLVISYNNTHHKSIGMTPAEVNISNEKQIFQKLYIPLKKNKNRKKEQNKFKIGTYVKISKDRYPFERGYRARYTNEIFVIKRVLLTTPVTYEITDLKDEPIKGRFYQKELIKIVKKDDDLYKIEKILKTKKKGKKINYFVKWLGYPDSFNSWVTDADLQKL